MCWRKPANIYIDKSEFKILHARKINNFFAMNCLFSRHLLFITEDAGLKFNL